MIAEFWWYERCSASAYAAVKADESHDGDAIGAVNDQHKDSHSGKLGNIISCFKELGDSE